ncbi:hypothetical protein KIPE111705_01740 [Kibdelosporangium persicum]|uniref:Uncharacterized protein n=1 Tax=Kibdelosporangium persicum TaxID=2698649 RepID=A0ABX2F694_9PSEU|nr:hypothetical protein [Kibdelosporangium persicum]NRN66881.1 hypothetical protein [Kibdelosporangium persicum]
MTEQRPQSEQQENLELRDEPETRDDPETWLENDPDAVRPETGTGTEAPQLATPDGGGAPADEEPTEIAEGAGDDYPAGPEQQAMRVEEG